MHIDLYLVLGSAVVGLLVGLTGMGGGALMTPMLVLLFGVTPSAAIASDLMAAFFMKPAGVVIHWRRKTVNTGVVRYLCYGSVPAAFFGTYVMHLLGQSALAEHRLEILLGTALLIGSVAIFYRSAFVTVPASGDETRQGTTTADDHHRRRRWLHGRTDLGGRRVLDPGLAGHALSHVEQQATRRHRPGPVPATHVLRGAGHPHIRSCGTRTHEFDHHR